MNEKEIRSRLERMGAAIKSRRVAVVTHNNPDPDCIAAAFGLCLLLKRHFRVDATIFYGGLVARAENRSMVDILKIPMRKIGELDLRAYRTLALVDTQPGAGNNESPVKAPLSIVIDHHKPVRKKTLSVPFHDVRTDYGSTSTIVTGYLRAAGVPITRNAATALYYGIKTDTYGLGRDVIPDDIEAYRFLMDKINVAHLGRIEKPEHPHNYFIQMHHALERTEIFENVAVSTLWKVDYPEITAEVADWLSSMRGIKWALVMSLHDCGIYLSIRTKSRNRDAGRVIRSVVGRHGMAGGHNQIAGGMVALEKCSPEAARAEVERLKERFYRIITKKDSVSPVPLIAPEDDA